MFENMLTQIFKDNSYCLNHRHFLSSRTKVSLTHLPTAAILQRRLLLGDLRFLLSNELSRKIQGPSPTLVSGKRQVPAVRSYQVAVLRTQPHRNYRS